MTEIPQPVADLMSYLHVTHPHAGMCCESTIEGVWFIDITYHDTFLAVEWSDITGFGVTKFDLHDKDIYGGRPDEAFDARDVAQRRITELLTA
jgi:hypothetical protein